MKNIFYALFALVLISCDSNLDVIVKDNFDFKVTTEQKEISFIGEEIKTTIKINPERVVKGTKYYFSYELNKGKGLYKMDGLTLAPGEEYELTSLEVEVVYVAEEVEVNEIKIKVRNDNDLEVEKHLYYKVVDLNDFKINLTKLTSDEVYFAEDIEFNLEIEKLPGELEEDLTYELKSTKQSLQGVLLVDGNELKLNEKITGLSEGKLSFIFSSTEVGNLELGFLVKASNGKEYEVKVDFVVKKTEVDLKITPSKTSNYVAYQTDFNIEVLKIGVEKLTFELSFDGSKGQLKDGAKTYLNTQVFDIDEGLHKMQYIGNEGSTVPIQFTLTASNGASVVLYVDFEVKESSFTSLITPSSNDNYIGEKTKFNVDINHIGAGDTNYEMYFTGANAEILKDGVVYKNSDIIPLGIGRSGFNYKGLEITKEPIKFVIKGPNGISKTQEISFESKPTDFEVTLGSDSFSNFYQFNLSSSFNIVPPDVKNQFLEYKFYYETNGLGTTSLTEFNTGVSITPGELLDMGSIRRGNISIVQTGVEKPQKGEIKFVFIDSNGVKVEKTATVDWYRN
jgi:hypothetical protein